MTGSRAPSRGRPRTYRDATGVSPTFRVGLAILALLAAAKLGTEFHRLVLGTPENLGAVDLVRRWSGERRTIIAVLHDLDQVRRNFPETLLISRERIGWGATAETLTAENLMRARQMSEAWDERAPLCEVHPGHS